MNKLIRDGEKRMGEIDIANLPKLSSDTPTVIEVEKWAYAIGRCFKGFGEERMYEYLSGLNNKGALDELFCEVAIASAHNGYTKGRFPVGRLKEVAKVAEWFIANVVEDDSAPVWCKLGGIRFRTMWVMVLILGYGGNMFQFARCEVARSIGAYPQLVQSFVGLMCDHKVIRKVINGCAYGGVEKGGKADSFEICDEDLKYKLFRLGPREKCRAWSRKAWRKKLIEELPWLNLEERCPKEPQVLFE